MFLVKESGKNLIKVYAEMPDIKWDLQMELNLSTVEYDLEIHIMFF